MTRRLVATICFTCALVTIAVIAQSSADDERRAAITALRAINTAENRVRTQTGRYVPLAELLEHGAMGGVKPNFTVNGNVFRHAGAEVRLALSADATQYVVTVVSPAPNHTAAFTNEGGIIYTGKPLE